jgi:hypothetical protein
MNQRFGGTCRLHFHCRRSRKARNQQETAVCCLIHAGLLLGFYNLPWRCRRHITSKYRFIFNELHNIISPKRDLFYIIAWTVFLFLTTDIFIKHKSFEPCVLTMQCECLALWPRMFTCKLRLVRPTNSSVRYTESCNSGLNLNPSSHTGKTRYDVGNVLNVTELANLAAKYRTLLRNVLVSNLGRVKGSEPWLQVLSSVMWHCIYGFLSFTLKIEAIEFLL